MDADSVFEECMDSRAGCWLAFFAAIIFCLSPSRIYSQSAAASPSYLLADSELPEAPTPQNTPAASGAQSAPAQSSSSADSSPQTAAQPADAKTQRDQAEQQLKQEEHQRVGGVMAAFNTTQNRDAIPLSSSQKFQLFFKSETDPWPFLLAGAVAGIGQADGSYPTWGQGMQGYGKRIGAAYSDAFIGNFFGNAVLTSLLHEDPRFYQKTDGSALSRTLWAATSTVWAKRDNGSWGPNYANIGGNFIGAAIARVYYPPSERHASDVIYDGITVSAEGIVGSEVIEWWPAIVRHHKRKMAEKQGRQMQPQPSISH
jgi:hypothetical protein